MILPRKSRSLFRPLLLLSGIFLSIGTAQAQHVEIGGFGDYEHVGISTFAKNAFGVGGRVDINLRRILQVEFESAYDVKRAYFVLASSTDSAVLTDSKLGILHANAGIKLQTRGGSFFLFMKGGANQYDPTRTVSNIAGQPITVTRAPVSLSTFTEGIFYPGGGIGFHAGPLGIRLDVGDEIYWDNGAHHNLRVTLGPTFRF